MKFQLLNSISAEKIFIYAGNPGTSALIAKEPTCFIMDGTRDGFNVQTATVGAAAKAHTLFAGLPPEAIPANEKGMIQVFGFVEDVVLLTGTRAASTDSYASAAAVAIGDVLRVNTVGNAMSRNAAGAATNAIPSFVAAGTNASVASAASTTSDTSVRRTGTVKAFLRAM